MNKINPLQKLLNCLKDQDDIIKKNTTYCACEIINKIPENAKHFCESGGHQLLLNLLLI